MRSKIRNLENSAKVLEPPHQVFRNWLSEASDYAIDFINNMGEGRAYTQGHPADDQWCSVHESGIPFSRLLEDVASKVDKFGINPASGGHLGYIPGGGIVPSAIGDYLAAISNRYAGIHFANPGAVQMENAMIRWMADLFSYPEEALGNLSSGGSVANLIAITTARDDHKVTRPEEYVVYLSPQTHHCIDKALAIAGLRHCQQRKLPLDSAFRIDPDAFEARIKSDRAAGLRPFLLVASMGTTDTGAVDPLDQLAEICEREGLWFHIDAAYGGFFILVDKLRHLFKGIERSDSIVIDPHKGLFLPYGTGTVLVKDGQKLKETHAYVANYMQDAKEPASQTSPASVSPELTKHFRGMRLWLPLRLFGLSPFRNALEEKHLLCLYFYHEIAIRGFETGPQPELSVAIYRYVPSEGDANAFNRSLLEAVHRDGRIFISSTLVDGVFWLRIAVLCFRTHLRHIDLLLNILEVERDKLLKNK